MGAIVFWTIVRTAILIPALWVLIEWIDYKFWWTLVIMSVYGVIHPAVIQYKLFIEKNKEILYNTLCSSCKHFEKSAVLCSIHDKHPALNFLPCEGVDWEPDGNSDEEKEKTSRRRK